MFKQGTGELGEPRTGPGTGSGGAGGMAELTDQKVKTAGSVKTLLWVH